MKNFLPIFVSGVIIFCCLGCSPSDSCKKDSDCPGGNKCIDEKCYPGAVRPDPQTVDLSVGCIRDEQCGACKKCNDGICKPLEGCDAGIVIIDAGRDIVKVDVEEDIQDIEDVGDVLEDAGDTVDVVAIDTFEDIFDAEIPDVLDAGDLLTDTLSCDISATLLVTKREPPGELPRGTNIKISGQGFDPECGTLAVYFSGDSNPARITEAASNYIRVIVPGFAKSGDITVKSFGQEGKLTGPNAFKLQRRNFYTEYGSSTSPGSRFYILSFPNFSDFKSGVYSINNEYPYPILLDPYNLYIIVISRDTDDTGGGTVISAYDFAEVNLIKSVTNTNITKPVSGAKMDVEKGLIYIISEDGSLHIHEMGTLQYIKSIPLGVALYGIDLDVEKNRIFITGISDSSIPPPVVGPPQDYRGALFVLGRDNFDTIKVITFGDMNSRGQDLLYHRKAGKIFVLEYKNGDLYLIDGVDYSSEIAPKYIGDGPMKMAFGKDLDKLYVVSNGSSRSPTEATAILRGFNVNDMSEVVGSPFDTKLITSTSSDNSRNQVNLIYDDLDGYLIVVSNADNRIAVIEESSLSFMSISPDNTKTNLSGNFGIVAEDW